MIACIATCLLWASPPAIPEGEALERVRVCLAAQDYACASVEAEAALASTPEPATRAWLLATRVESQLRLDLPADGAIDALLEAEAPPRPEWPRQWQERVEARRLLRVPTTAEVTPLAAARAGVGLELRVTVRGARRGDRVVVTLPGLELPLEVGGCDRPCTFEGVSRVPGEWLKSAKLAGSVRVLRAGAAAAEQPFVFNVAPAAELVETPAHETWWFWTATLGGIALVAGVSALTWALVTDDETTSVPTGPEFGDVRVEVLWPGSASR